MISFKKRKSDGGDFYKYLWRVGSAIENGSAGCTWDEAAKYINKEWGKDYTSSAYRKPVQYAKPFYDHVFCESEADDMLEQLKEQRDELYKLKKQYQDQRREYNKVLAKEAREDHLYDIIAETARKLQKHELDVASRNKKVYVDDDEIDEAVLVLSDWHYGMTTDNIWNKYNTEICKDRVAQLLVETIDAVELHKIHKIHVVLLGDAYHGACHVGCRVDSEEYTVSQIMHVSELIAGFISVLSRYVDDVEVYSTFGNHGRTIQNKNDSIHNDNMEKIIMWYLAERLSKNENIHLNPNDYEDIILFDCCGFNIFATHGDLDRFDNLALNANMLCSKKFGKQIDYAIAGDKHSSKEYDTFGIETIQVSSLCGVDAYAHDHRLYSHPGQTLMIFTPEYGRRCTYNIKFDTELYNPKDETQA